MARKCFASAALSSGFREKWAAVHEGCDIHVLPGAFTKIFRLAVDDVRGLLHHALSLGQGSHLDLFRKALRLELRHRGLVLRQGAPPAHVQQRNELAFLTALAGSKYEVFARSRWTGSDLATDCCGILQRVSALGSSVYARSVHLVGERRRPHHAGPQKAAAPVPREPDFWGLFGRPGKMDRIGFGNPFPSFDAKEKKKQQKKNTCN